MKVGLKCGTFKGHLPFSHHLARAYVFTDLYSRSFIYKIGQNLGNLERDYSYQFSSVAQSCPTPCDPINCSTPGLPVHHKLLEFSQTHAHWVDDAIQPSHPLLSPSPPAPNPSQHQGLFQRVNSSHEVARVLEFQLQHQSFQWTPRTDLLAVQGTLKSLLQHHSSKSSIFRCSAFFTVQLSHPHMTTGKNIALTRWTFVGKVRYQVAISWWQFWHFKITHWWHYILWDFLLILSLKSKIKGL